VFVQRVSGKTGAAEKSKPDILMIMPDQMRGDGLSALGHPVVRTPNLDALAREGALFRRAYATCPSCIPARHSLLTGLFPATSGMVGFKTMRTTHPTLPALLGATGYSTALVGRTMHQDPPNKTVGYQKEILGSTYEKGDAYDRFFKEATGSSMDIRQTAQQWGLSYNGWEAKPWPLANELHPTAWAVREARQFLATAESGKPLFLTASFYAPHPPLFPPKEYFDKYFHTNLPAPAHGDWVDWKSLSPEGDKKGHRVLLAGDALRHTQAGYFGLIEHLDAQIAPLIAAFKERSRKAGRPWVIVFTSDHGEMLGDHGYFRKCEPYEGAANIPFLIAGSPELKFQSALRCAAPVCLEDILPTLLELAGTPCPKPMDGVSLLPVLRGAQPGVRSALHTEHAPMYGSDQAFHALTDGHFKYVWRPANGAEQLFHLDQDPREEHDLARDPAQRGAVEQWRARLARELAGRPEGFSDGNNLIAGRPYLPIIKPEDAAAKPQAEAKPRKKSRK
jgi:arylsulfatase A-like enzyme